MKKIFVYGWYGHSNLGDESFKQAFQDLWGQWCTFTFGDFIPNEINELYDACFIGGGSFLDQPIAKIDIVKIPIGFIGVGIHKIHEANQSALNRALIVLSRNYHEEYAQVSDLIFARSIVKKRTPKKLITVLLNQFVVRDRPSWMFDGFKNFMNHFPKVCDEWVENGYEVIFYPMCRDLINDDRMLAFKIVSEMKHGESDKLWVVSHGNESDLIEAISHSEKVVSMRYHGLLYSTLLGVPFVGINSHDKMKSYFDDIKSKSFIDYYAFDPVNFNECLTTSDSSGLLEFARKEKEKWVFLSGAVKERFGM